MGAVNGMRPNGKIDYSYIQGTLRKELSHDSCELANTSVCLADEVWTGVTYALASFFIQQVSSF